MFNPQLLTDPNLTEEDRQMLMKQLEDQQMIQEAKLSNSEYANLSFARAGKSLGNLASEALQGPDPASEEAMRREQLKGNIDPNLDQAAALRARAAQFRNAGQHTLALKLEDRAIGVEEKAATRDLRRLEIVAKRDAATMDRELKARGMDMKQLQEALKNNLFTPESKNAFLKSRNLDDLQFRKEAIQLVPDPNDPAGKKKIVTFINPQGNPTVLNREPMKISLSNDATFKEATEGGDDVLGQAKVVVENADAIWKSTGVKQGMDIIEAIPTMETLAKEALNGSSQAKARLQTELLKLGRGDSNPSSKQFNANLTSTGLYDQFQEFLTSKTTGGITADQYNNLIKVLSIAKRENQDKIRSIVPEVQDFMLQGSLRTGTPVERRVWNLAMGRVLRAAGDTDQEIETAYGKFVDKVAPQAVPKSPVERAVGKKGQVTERSIPTTAPLPQKTPEGSKRGVSTQQPTSRQSTETGPVDISKYFK